MQEQRQLPKSCVSSSFNLHAGVSNNTKEAVAISICRVAGHLRPRTPINSVSCRRRFRIFDFDPGFRRDRRRFQFASKSHFSDNEDKANVSDRSCKYPPCKIGETPDFVSSVTCSHDTRRLSNNIFRRQRPFSYGIDRPKVICGGGVTGFSRRV
jgi:hypothetical protein